MRARDLGIVIGPLATGEHNAITDVAGVQVGHTTLVEGEAVRTGVTVIRPHEGEPLLDPLFAGYHRLNGNGELTGIHWIEESGLLSSTIGLTNTHSVGVVRDALVADAVQQSPADAVLWSMPVVGETYDGGLNEINGQHVTAAHVHDALASATAGPVAEGSVGSGTGMVCHEFKGGIGTSSRVLAADDGGHTVGVLTQCNHGRRHRLRVNGVAVGERLDAISLPSYPTSQPPGTGSIIVVVATDAPLLPLQCRRLAQRAALGIARTGGAGENGSGDLILCLATGNRGLHAVIDKRSPTVDVTMVGHVHIDALFDAVIDATEEAILNSMLQSQTMHGRGGSVVHGLDPDALLAALAASG
ncbi:MAG: D-aminopeptidase [Gaiellales bacterium]|jgi:D-aminopeptidase|nr:D-aminopeptidase [Gaiellales bacterium]